MFYRKIGSLSIFVDPKQIESVQQGNDMLNIPYRKLSNEDLKREFPMMKLPDSAVATYESHSGAILSDKALQAFQVGFY